MPDERRSSPATARHVPHDERRSREAGSGISPTTLALAAIASAAAAIITRELWGPGAIIGAALTPVIVTLVTEAIHRPSKHVVQRVRQVSPRTRAYGEPEVREETEVLGEPEPATPEAPYAERRVYGRRRRLAWRVAVITGAAAFLIAAAALTFSELVLDGAVAGDERTTIFGGRDADEQRAPADEEKTKTEEESPTPTPTPDEKREGEDPDASPTPSPAPSPEVPGEATPPPAATPAPGAPEAAPSPAPTP